MFTAQVLGDSANKVTQRRTVTVRFTEGVQEFEKDFSFQFDTSLIEIKQVVRSYLEEINLTLATVPVGAVDFSDIPAPPTPVPPTVLELAKAEWFSDLEKLKKVDELVKLGVLTGLETPVVNLRNKLKAGFKNNYVL